MTDKKRGHLYLVPTPIIDGGIASIPEANRLIVSQCKYFLVESLKLGRRHVKAMVPTFDFNLTVFEELSKNTDHAELDYLLDPALKGFDICVLSDAGSPVIADPGSNIVQLAHRHGIEVVPLSGPSSIMLALMASGLSGQNFVFHGYLSRDKGTLKNDLKRLEQDARKGYSQIFMETPYRNTALFEQILNTLNGDILFCIAADLTSPKSLIKTQSIAQWKKDKTPDLHKRPCIFIVGV
ncbi:MAG: SAM-dependent methyltransferase [Saprospiraceae bacterium]|nr:SAM-dependent methyltransferase [Saprospiraceae bacterium]